MIDEFQLSFVVVVSVFRMVKTYWKAQLMIFFFIGKKPDDGSLMIQCDTCDNWYMYHGIVLELQKRWQTPCRPMRVQDVRSRVVIKLSNVVILYFSPFQYGYKRSRD